MSSPPFTSTTGRYVTRCKLCHKPVAESVSLDIPLIGSPGKRAEALIAVLMRHLTKHHEKELAEGAALTAELPPFLILSAFDCEDPSMKARLEKIRASIFAIVRKNSMSDSAIDTIVAHLALEQSERADVTAALRSVRDACCEFDQFTSQRAESRIITG